MTSNASADGILDAARDSTGATAASGTSVHAMDISTLTDSATDLGTLDGYIKAADSAIKEMTSSATSLGAEKQRIGLQSDFVSALKSAISEGIGQLVDADMNEEFDAVAGPPGQATARCPGAQHREPVEPEYSLTLPLINEGRLTHLRRAAFEPISNN